MLLHVIWGFVEERALESPTFSISSVMLQWADSAPAHVQQGRFEWCDGAWEAEIEVSRGAGVTHAIRGRLRLTPEVLRVWTLKSLNPRSEASRQLREAMLARGWRGELGTIHLTT